MSRPYTREEAVRIARHSAIPTSFGEGLCAILDRECEKETVFKLVRDKVFFCAFPCLPMA